MAAHCWHVDDDGVYAVDLGHGSGLCFGSFDNPKMALA
jgi:hypothetical protein